MENNMSSVGYMNPEVSKVCHKEICLGVVSGPSHTSYYILSTPPLTLTEAATTTTAIPSHPSSNQILPGLIR